MSLAQEKRAERALLYFWERVQKFTPHNPMGFLEFKTFITSKYSPRFFALFGSSIEISGFSETKIKSLMEKLADGYKGDLPARGELGRFNQALIGELNSFSFRTSMYAEQVGAGLKEAAQTVGKVAAVGAVGYMAFLGLGLAFLIYSNRAK